MERRRRRRLLEVMSFYEDLCVSCMLSDGYLYIQHISKYVKYIKVMVLAVISLQGFKELLFSVFTTDLGSIQK